MEKASKLELPHLDEVLVTFIRSSVMAPTTKAGLWDRERFIGEMKVRNIVQYKTTPGKHLFLASGEHWSYVEANLQGGLHYVIKAEVVPGGTQAQIYLKPIAPGGKTTKEDIEEWLSELDSYKPSEKEAEEYTKTHLGSVKKAIQRYDEGRVTFEEISPRDSW